MSRIRHRKGFYTGKSEDHRVVLVEVLFWAFVFAGALACVALNLAPTSGL